MDIRRYLLRIRYHGDTRPTLENLRAIHLAHVLAVPFENLSVHSGEEIELDLQLLYTKIVVKRRGGVCYEGNGLFSWVLDQLGFEFKMVAAAVYDAEKGDYGSEMDHLINIVTIDGEDWLTDVAYGGEMFRTPMRMAADQQHPDANGTHRLRQEGALWFLQYKGKPKLDADCSEASPGGTQQNDIEESVKWTALHKFTLQERKLQDFSEECIFKQRFHPFFIGRPFCALHLADGLITYIGRKLITTRYYDTHLTKSTAALGTDDDIMAVLWETFGIKLENHLVVKE